MYFRNTFISELITFFIVVFIEFFLPDDKSSSQTADVELLLLSWIHSQSTDRVSDVTSGLRGLSQSRLRIALKDALKEYTAPRKKSEADWKNDDDQTSLIKSEAREESKGFVESVTVKACLALLSQSNSIEYLGDFLLNNFKATQALGNWLEASKNWA